MRGEDNRTGRCTTEWRGKVDLSMNTYYLNVTSAQILPPMSEVNRIDFFFESADFPRISKISEFVVFVVPEVF